MIVVGVGKYISPSAWKERIYRWKRTIDVARKPDKDEFINSVKVSMAGVIIIGTIGFIIFLIYQFVVGFL